MMRGYCFNDCYHRGDCGLGMNELREWSYVLLKPAPQLLTARHMKIKKS